jgi:hypothetical protein
MKHKRRKCPVDNVLGCTADWLNYNPNFFPREKCTQKLFNKICINQTKTIYRSCDRYNNSYWKCEAYEMVNGIVGNKLLYVAYLPHYWDTYDVSRIGKKETDEQLKTVIGLKPDANGGSGSEIVDSWTAGEQALGEVF